MKHHWFARGSAGAWLLCASGCITAPGTSLGDGSTGSESSASGQTTTGSDSAVTTQSGSSDNSTSDGPTGSTGAVTDAASTGTDEGSSSGGVPTPEVCPTFIDDFEDGEQNPLWVQPYPESIRENNGLGIINVTAEASDQFARMMLQPEHGGLESATARMEIVQTPNRPSMTMVMWVHPPGEGRINWGLTTQGPDTILQLQITDLMGVQEEAFSIPYDPDAHRWLQLREADGTTFYEASADGVDFQTVFEAPTPFDVSEALVGFASGNFGPLPGDEQVSIESFQFDCGPPP